MSRTITLDVPEPGHAVYLWEPGYSILEGEFAGTKIGTTLDGSPYLSITLNGTHLGTIRLALADIATAVLHTFRGAK